MYTNLIAKQRETGNFKYLINNLNSFECLLNIKSVK